MTTPDLIDRHDAVSYIDSMTWGRVFPAEPAPSTRDLVVFTAALGAAKRRLALIDAAPRAATEPESALRRAVENYLFALDAPEPPYPLDDYYEAGGHDRRGAGETARPPRRGQGRGSPPDSGVHR
jgi:hypothetical protein